MKNFKNDNVLVVIFKFLTLTTLKIMKKFDPNLNLKFLICQIINLSHF